MRRRRTSHETPTELLPERDVRLRLAESERAVLRQIAQLRRQVSLLALALLLAACAFAALIAWKTTDRITQTEARMLADENRSGASEFYRILDDDLDALERRVELIETWFDPAGL